MGLGQSNQTLPLELVIISAAIGSFYLTDVRGSVQLNRPLANLIAVVAVGFAISKFFRVSSEEQLMAIARMLVYLQAVLLFQRKSPRVYWQLLVLSVLQVVIGAAISFGMLFGALLVVYLFVAVAVLGLLFIQRESQYWQAMAAAVASSATFPKPEIAVVKSSARRLTRLTQPFASCHSFHADPAAQLLGRGVFGRTIGIGLGTLVVAAICFFFMPRFGRASREGGMQRATIGYSPTVKLGDLGPLLQDPALIMRVGFRNLATGEPLKPADPLWRGSLLTTYLRGEWTHPPSARQSMGQQSLWALQPAPPRLGLVHQRITIEPLAQQILFSVYPPYEPTPAHPNRHLFFDADRQELVRSPDVQQDKFDYDLLTAGWRQGEQSRIVPQSIAFVNGQRFLGRFERRELLDLPDTPGKQTEPRDMLTGLRALAAEKVAAAHLAADDAYGKAKLLERVLSSPPFEYSLDRGTVADNVDPIEDFVTRNHRGHCEYFASALALMLRSQKIPARMVMGFRGGEWNELGSYFDVRQLHAHAWVEAYLTRKQIAGIPESERPAEMQIDDGAWLVLDATPSSQASAALVEGTWMNSAADMADYVQSLWNYYIVGLNADRQQRVIYNPLAVVSRAAEALWRNPKQVLEAIWQPKLLAMVEPRRQSRGGSERLGLAQ